MNNFWQRAITGTIFVVVLVGAIVLGGWYMHVTFGIVVLLGLLEFYKLFENTETRPQRIAGTIIGLIIYLLFALTEHFGPPSKGLALLSLIVSLVIISIIELGRNRSKPFENIALTFIAIPYLVVPFILLFMMTGGPCIIRDYTDYHFWPIISIFILIWSNDTFAYLTGRLIGKHKLFERISPKKTWEGFIGGVFFALIAGILLAYFLHESYLKYITYALVAGVIGTLGDLVQSMLKRSVNVKDSGTLLPGHGGILDRFDAVLFVVPVIFYLDKFIFAKSFF